MTNLSRASKPQSDFPPQVKYLVARASDTHIDPVHTYATRREAQQEADYWTRWAPGSPRIVIEATTTYRVLTKPPDRDEGATT